MRQRQGEKRFRVGPMQILFELLVVLHFVGLALLLGGAATQLSSATKVVNPAMLHGSLTQLVTGVGMVGLAEAALPDEKEGLSMPFISLKLVILLVIVALCWINRNRKEVPVGVWAAIGALTLANIVIAVFM
jgi:cytochrome bd-type quinol oxidase subunit 2